MRPFEANRKIFIIPGAEGLTLESSNTLLKTLEEPTPSSILILTTSVPENVLETVLSRCHVIRFYPSALEELAGELKADLKISNAEAEFLSSFSEGCKGKALQMHEKKVFDRKNSVIDNVIRSNNSEAFFKKVLADKLETKEMLRILLSFFRDLILVKKTTGGCRLIHADRIRDLEQLSGKYTFKDLDEILAQIIKASEMSVENLNVKVAMNLLKARI